MAEEKPERRPGKSEAVYRQLKAGIEDGSFLPGQTLPEAMLVEHTGASRTPVREALRRLASEGLVKIAPRTAATVARISLRSVRELYDYRRILEPAAIRLVAGKAEEDPQVTERFADLSLRLERVAGLSYSAEFARDFRELTAEFDTELIVATPNTHLARAIEELRPHTARLRNIAHTEQERLHESLREHIVMCQAIIDGDSEAAAQALTEHLMHVDEAIFKALLTGGGDSRSGGAVELVS